MRSLGFEFPDQVFFDAYTAVADIYRIIDGGQDEWGNELPPEAHYFAQDAPADLQTKSGNQRAQESGTDYESTHVLYLRSAAVPIPQGALVDVKDQDGTVVGTYTVVFAADWGTHLELDLKER